MPSPPSAYAATVRATPDLIEYWRFEGTLGGPLPLSNELVSEPDLVVYVYPGATEHIGLSTEIAVPQGYDGTYTSTLPCHGTALEFPLEGTAAWTPVSLNAPAGSIEAWVSHLDGTIWASSDILDSAFSHQLWFLGGAPGTYYWSVRDGSGWQHASVSEDAVPHYDGGATQILHHWVVTWEEGVRTQIYVDGTFRDSVPLGALTADRAHFWIGPRTPIPTGGEVNTFTFNGIIDELAIYERVLTADEIATHYAAGRRCPALSRARAWFVG